MLRQRSSEVMARTFYRPPYALHVGLGLGVFQTICYPPNWLFSRRARPRGVGADGWRKLHCAHGESDNRRGMQVRRKEKLTLIGGGCIFNSEWARTFSGIRASNQSAAKAYCVACNTHFGIGHGGRHDVKRPRYSLPSPTCRWPLATSLGC